MPVITSKMIQWMSLSLFLLLSSISDNSPISWSWRQAFAITTASFHRHTSRHHPSLSSSSPALPRYDQVTAAAGCRRRRKCSTSESIHRLPPRTLTWARRRTVLRSRRRSAFWTRRRRLRSRRQRRRPSTAPGVDPANARLGRTTSPIRRAVCEAYHRSCRSRTSFPMTKGTAPRTTRSGSFPKHIRVHDAQASNSSRPASSNRQVLRKIWRRTAKSWPTSTRPSSKCAADRQRWRDRQPQRSQSPLYRSKYSEQRTFVPSSLDLHVHCTYGES